MDLLGRVAFITGGASGIGRAMAQCFGRAGMRVAILDIEAAALAESEAILRDEGIPVRALHCDVTDRAAMREAAAQVQQEFTEIHLLCNNAGVAMTGPIDEMTDGDWDWVLSVNLGGVVNGLLSVLPILRAQGGEGHVVNTASLAGLITAPQLGVYSASKFAVVGLSECLRAELEPHGIGVSVLCPGFVRTRIDQASRNRPDKFGGPGNPEPSDFIQAAMEPDRVAERVRGAVERNEFYILTHPEAAPVIEQRSADILNSFRDE